MQLGFFYPLNPKYLHHIHRIKTLEKYKKVTDQEHKTPIKKKSRIKKAIKNSLNYK
jgi:2-phosphoglycerate kinase